MKPVYAALLCLLPGLCLAQTPPTIPVDEPPAAEPQPVPTIPVDERPAAEPQPLALRDSFVRGYYVASNKLHGDGDTITGDGGFGVGGVLGIGLNGGMHPFLIGDYQRTRFEDFDQTEKNMRLGLGWQFTSILGAYVEYADIRFANKLDGPGLHLRVTPVVGPVVLAFDVGYLDLNNNRGPQLDGFDAGIAASIPVMQALSALVDYRATVLSPKDDGNSLTLSDLRIGVRYDWP